MNLVLDRDCADEDLKKRKNISHSNEKGESMRYLIFVVLLMAVILTAGCVSENKNTLVTPTQSTPSVNASGTTIPQMTVVSEPAQNYKTADLGLTLNTKPAYGFKMDYPAEWKYEQMHSSNWKGSYKFSSPDYESEVWFHVSDQSGSGNYFYPINTWANNTIKSMKESYCRDGAGNIMQGECSPSQKTYYHRVLVSNDPVIIKGSFEARKLVFTSYDDENYGRDTLYIMHSGQMQGYNFTIPDHPEVAVKVDGPAWDYGIGGQAYVIEFYSPANRVNSTTDIFNHMINTFEITG